MEYIIGMLLDNSFIEPPGSNRKIWGKERALLTLFGTPSREIRTCNTIRSQQELKKVKKIKHNYPV